MVEEDDLPKDLTAGIGEPAQMSVEDVLAGWNGEGGGLEDYTERQRRVDTLEWQVDRHR